MHGHAGFRCCMLEDRPFHPAERVGHHGIGEARAGYFGGAASFTGMVPPMGRPRTTLRRCHLACQLAKAVKQPIEAVVWPSSLQQLDLGDDFNQPIERVD